MSLLAYTPLLDPIEVGWMWWMLLPPLAMLIALVWKSLRVTAMRRLAASVVVMTFQIIAAMALLGLAAFLFIQYIAPMVLPIRA